MRAIFLIIAVSALAGCASKPPRLQTGAQCMSVNPKGYCNEWRFGPTVREAEAFDRRHRVSSL